MLFRKKVAGLPRPLVLSHIFDPPRPPPPPSTAGSLARRPSRASKPREASVSAPAPSSDSGDIAGFVIADLIVSTADAISSASDYGSAFSPSTDTFTGGGGDFGGGGSSGDW